MKIHACLGILLILRVEFANGCESGGSITVSAGQTCTISSSTTVDIIQVDGTLVIAGNPSDSDTIVRIKATSITVSENGIITADGQGFPAQSGHGAGASSGSGGK